MFMKSLFYSPQTPYKTPVTGLGIVSHATSMARVRVCHSLSFGKGLAAWLWAVWSAHGPSSQLCGRPAQLWSPGGVGLAFFSPRAHEYLPPFPSDLQPKACNLHLEQGATHQGAGNCAGSERSMEDSVGDVLLWQMATTASPVVTGVLPAQGRCVC